MPFCFHFLIKLGLIEWFLAVAVVCPVRMTSLIKEMIDLGEWFLLLLGGCFYILNMKLQDLNLFNCSKLIKS